MSIFIIYKQLRNITDLGYIRDLLTLYIFLNLAKTIKNILFTLLTYFKIKKKSVSLL